MKITVQMTHPMKGFFEKPLDLPAVPPKGSFIYSMSFYFEVKAVIFRDNGDHPAEVEIVLGEATDNPPGLD